MAITTKHVQRLGNFNSLSCQFSVVFVNVGWIAAPVRSIEKKLIKFSLIFLQAKVLKIFVCEYVSKQGKGDKSFNKSLHP